MLKTRPNEHLSLKITSGNSIVEVEKVGPFMIEFYDGEKLVRGFGMQPEALYEILLNRPEGQ